MRTSGTDVAPEEGTQSSTERDLIGLVRRLLRESPDAETAVSSLAINFEGEADSDQQEGRLPGNAICFAKSFAHLPAADFGEVKSHYEDLSGAGFESAAKTLKGHAAADDNHAFLVCIEADAFGGPPAEDRL
uniref:Uncharacterized protein n=1 Tax=Odontella aurita TaxID=265563 RepID=A0A7S4KBS5_9STRA|mmetsp:Transcript_8867/g.26572  ORF Transcript_8867/g.26572 Transcript_8867/m.26572 type:complete len:132 (+) Transcript_8867:1138-1533(+)